MSNAGGKTVIVLSELKSRFKSVSVAAAKVLIKEVWSVVFSEHMLWHEISEALATVMLWTCWCSSLPRSLVRQVTEYRFWIAFLIVCLFRRAFQCFY